MAFTARVDPEVFSSAWRQNRVSMRSQCEDDQLRHVGIGTKKNVFGQRAVIKLLEPEPKFYGESLTLYHIY